ncbi:hypothetical protein LTS72_27345 [Mycobacterium ostraviense]|nr:hypothetical protein [Mycobacterium ostraviense]UGT94672.1 hypothetical protein LTS72_27345 [Mycobacterium ostraviense]
MPVKALLNIVNSPAQVLLGRPLFGNGINGAGTGQDGGPGGLLIGNGGSGGSGAPGQNGGDGGPPGCSAPVASAASGCRVAIEGRAEPAGPAVPVGCSA